MNKLTTGVEAVIVEAYDQGALDIISETINTLQKSVAEHGQDHTVPLVDITRWLLKIKLNVQHRRDEKD